MTTLTKAKKAVRKSNGHRSPSKRLAEGFEISAITGLPFKPMKPGQKPISRDALKAALADSL